MNPEIMSFQYATGIYLLLENVGASEQNRLVANVQSDDLCPSRMHADTHILQEKTHACGVLKRHYFRVHESIVCNISVVFLGHSVEYSFHSIGTRSVKSTRKHGSYGPK